MVFKFEWVPALAKGLPLTLQITFTCIGVGIVLGVLLALARVYGNRPLRWVTSIYIQFFRGTPLLVQLFIVYFGLPTWGITLSRFTSAVLALGLNTAAYQAEYFRGAIQAVRGGQVMAARSLGMSMPQAVRYVVLPQAFRLVLPSWSNEFILMLKYSSIVFIITLNDLMGLARHLASRNFRYFEVFVVVALFYLALVSIISFVLRMIERRVRVPGLGSAGAEGSRQKFFGRGAA
ncbi:MAG: amino acid ABC transporter permease [Candidatus Bipolaricaulia bacterium]